jgi:hypothetical protein
VRRQGHRVYYPHDARHRGKYTNNQHWLQKLDLPGGAHRLTLVVSQYEKVRGIDYTLSVQATAPFTLAPTPLAISRSHRPFRLVGRWTAKTAGGSARHESYGANPQYALTLPVASALHLRLEAPVAYHVGTRLFRPAAAAVAGVVAGAGRNAAQGAATGAPAAAAAGAAAALPPRVGRLSKGEVQVASSGDYRQGFCFFEVGVNADAETATKPTPLLPAGVYVLVVSSFDPGQTGGFILTAEVTCSGARLEPLPAA